MLYVYIYVYICIYVLTVQERISSKETGFPD